MLTQGICLLLLSYLSHCLFRMNLFSGNKTECVQHNTIDDDSRYYNYYQSYGNDKCDQHLQEGWYRFVTHKLMNTNCGYSDNYCNTDHPGWLNGNHPSVEEGVVTRTVCFNSGSCSCNYGTDIKVLNCGSFYVYKLKPTPTCNLRYCTQ